jgi:hypothetical protein
MFVSIEKIIRRFPLAALLVAGPFALYFQSTEIDRLTFLDNIQVAEAETHNNSYWTTRPLQHKSDEVNNKNNNNSNNNNNNNNTSIRNEHKTHILRHPHNGSDSFQGNDERPEFDGNKDDDNVASMSMDNDDDDDDDDDVLFTARSMDGVDSAHMAKDGTWVQTLTTMLKCDRMRELKKDQNTYARIPTKTTWYVH